MSEPSILLWPELFRLAKRASQHFGIKRFKKLEPLTDKRAR